MDCAFPRSGPLRWLLDLAISAEMERLRVTIIGQCWIDPSRLLGRLVASRRLEPRLLLQFSEKLQQSPSHVLTR